MSLGFSLGEDYLPSGGNIPSFSKGLVNHHRSNFPVAYARGNIIAALREPTAELLGAQGMCAAVDTGFGAMALSPGEDKLPCCGSFTNSPRVYISNNPTA